MRPSNRITDPNNVMGIVAVAAGKHKAVCKPIRNVKPKTTSTTSIPSGDEEDQDEDTEGNYAPTPTEVLTDIDEEVKVEDSEEYEVLKVMADVDHKVLTLYYCCNHTNIIPQAIHIKSKDDATADIRTLFRRDKDYKIPDSDKTGGSWCSICL
jgi:hypothetical protein